jgi:hypothetical protein
MAYVTCRLDRQKNRKIFYWEKHHHYYIEQWELLDANVDENDESRRLFTGNRLRYENNAMAPKTTPVSDQRKIRQLQSL